MISQTESQKERKILCQLALWRKVFILYYLQDPVLVQHYTANENFIHIGSYMMPYALDRRDNDKQIKKKKEGKMIMTGGEFWKTHMQTKLLFEYGDKKRGSSKCCGNIYTMRVL